MATVENADAATEGLYEAMFLLDSGKFASDPSGSTDHVLEMITNAGGNVEVHRPWQDGKLAYEINGHRKGLHYLVYFRMPTSGVELLTRACKLSDLVLRQLVIRQPAELFDTMVAAYSEGAEGPQSNSGAQDDSDSDDNSDDDDDED